MDLLFNYAKYEIIFRSLTLFTEKLEKIYYSYLNEIKDNPILISFCHPQETNIYYLPTPTSIKRSIFEFFISEKIYVVIFRRSFIDPQEFINYMRCYDEVFCDNCDQNSNLSLRIKEDIQISDLFLRIMNVVENSFKEIEKYSKILLPIKQNHNTYSLIDLDNLKEDIKPQEIKDLFERFNAEEEKISQLKAKKHIGIFEYNIQNL